MKRLQGSWREPDAIVTEGRLRDEDAGNVTLPRGRSRFNASSS
jgi:hypothetical protein